MMASIKTIFQNVLFYVLSDDYKWAQENLESISDSIYFTGAMEEFVTNQTLSEVEQKGIFY